MFRYFFYYPILVLRLQLVSLESIERNPMFWRSSALSLFHTYTSLGCNDSRRRKYLQENERFFLLLVTRSQSPLLRDREEEADYSAISPLLILITFLR